MKIEYTSLEHLESFWQAIDQVARERKYLLFTQAPEIEKTQSFLNEIIEKNWTQFFAFNASEVIGWCDIIPYSFDGCTHVGHLGMGVTKGNRRKGIGEQLLSTAIQDAYSKGIERIEMEVFSTNEGAIALYEKLGFLHEGRKSKARKIDGVEYDFLIMALHKER